MTVPRPSFSQHELEQQLSDRDIRLLEDLERFRLLTTRQLQRLHFPAAPLGPHRTASAATRGTTRVLNRLEGRGTIARLDRRIGGIKHGSALTIWQLAAAGDRFLRTRRGETTRRRYLEPGLTFTRHTLAVNDVAVEIIERANAGHYELLELEVEPDCWRSHSSATGGTLTLKPDLFLVTADQSTETHSFVEIDLGTEHAPTVLRKCQGYHRYAASGLEQLARGLFPAVVWIVPSVERAKLLRERIAAEPGLDPHMFWIITPEAMTQQLAPYPAPTTT